MANNNIIKNRYYMIIKDNETYAYISVKKDFYTEGIIIKDKSVLSGYFPFYETFKAFILDNSMQSFEHYLEGICISPNVKKDYFNIDGKIICQNYTLYDADMDEYCDVVEKSEKCQNIQIKLIEDEELIKDINYLIRSGIRNLNNVYMFYYNSLKNHRYGNLKELIWDLKDINIDEKGTKMHEETIKDLKEYFKNLYNTGEIKEKSSKTKVRNKNNKPKH